MAVRKKTGDKIEVSGSGEEASVPKKRATRSIIGVKKTPTKKKVTGKKKTVTKKATAQEDVPAEKPERTRRTSNTCTKEVEKMEKIDKILELKRGGATFRQISEHMTGLGYKGCSRSQVCNLFKEGMDMARDHLGIEFGHWRELELDRLETRELALSGNLLRIADLDSQKLKAIQEARRANDWDKLAAILDTGFHSDHVEKYERALDRISRRRDSLLGLSKPQKVEHTGENGKPLEIVTRVILPSVTEVSEEEEAWVSGGLE